LVNKSFRNPADHRGRYATRPQLPASPGSQSVVRVVAAGRGGKVLATIEPAGVGAVGAVGAISRLESPDFPPEIPGRDPRSGHPARHLRGHSPTGQRLPDSAEIAIFLMSIEENSS
jgi:hypothetical protein